MGKRPQRALGFTLVEVLITMGVLAMVMLTGAWAYSFMATSWERNQKNFNLAIEHYQDWSLISRAVESTIPKIVRHDEFIGFYFLGEERGFTAYTSRSVQDPEYPAVYRFFREQDPDTQLFSLVYEEAVLTQQILTHSEQQLPFNFRLEVANELEDVRFEYFGWESLRARSEEEADEFGGTHFPQWFDEYDGIERVQHPRFMQVHIDGFLWPVEVADISYELMRRVGEQDI